MARSALPYLRQARFVHEPGDWTLLHYADGARPDTAGALAWLALPRDHTLVVPTAHADTAARRAPPLARSDGWSLLTIEVEVPLDVGGFFQHFAKALGDAGVPIVPLAAYRCDHVLVPTPQVERAMAALESVRVAHA